MNWDPFQREMLEALGHSVYEQVLPGETTQQMPLHRLQQSEGLDTSLLMSAIAQAAAVKITALPNTINWQVLRTDPAAKRALWPQLRGLRAGRMVG